MRVLDQGLDKRSLGRESHLRLLSSVTQMAWPGRRLLSSGAGVVERSVLGARLSRVSE